MSIEKIKADLAERSIRKSIGYLPQTGHSEHEFDHRFCTSSAEGMDGYTVVVSKIFKYNNQSLDDFSYAYYVYDKDGNFVEDENINSKCKGKFLETLKDLE